MLSQIIRAGRLDRSFFTSLLFDYYAVGNAVALVALLAAIPALLLSNLSVVVAVSAALYGLMWAGLTAVAAWAVATRILRRDGRIPTTFRLTAFAHVALIPTIFIPLFPGFLAVLVVGSLAWFFMAMRIVADVQFDLVGQDTLQVAGAAVAVRFVLLLV